MRREMRGTKCEIRREFEGLAELRLNLLKAIVIGVDKEITREEVIRKPTCFYPQ